MKMCENVSFREKVSPVLTSLTLFFIFIDGLGSISKRRGWMMGVESSGRRRM